MPAREKNACMRDNIRKTVCVHLQSLGEWPPECLQIDGAHPQTACVGRALVMLRVMMHIHGMELVEMEAGIGGILRRKWSWVWLCLGGGRVWVSGGAHQVLERLEQIPWKAGVKLFLVEAQRLVCQGPFLLLRLILLQRCLPRLVVLWVL